MLFSLVGNAGYALMLGAFVARDVLVLRACLAVGQAIVALYTGYNGVFVVSAWNGAFTLVNAVAVVQILRERKAVTLPEDLQPVYERHFAALTPPEFLRWWHQGQRETVTSGALARHGERPSALYFLVSGRARVHREGQPITDLPGGFFVAEMSLITGRAASADVDVVVPTDLVRWPRTDLDGLRETNPVLWTKIQSVIGLDLVEKVRRGEGVAAA
jgi:hypothetical protein